MKVALPINVPLPGYIKLKKGCRIELLYWLASAKQAGEQADLSVELAVVFLRYEGVKLAEEFTVGLDTVVRLEQLPDIASDDLLWDNLRELVLAGADFIDAYVQMAMRKHTQNWQLDVIADETQVEFNIVLPQNTIEGLCHVAKLSQFLDVDLVELSKYDEEIEVAED